ncbi:S6A14-like protein [Mya arenaria]|uniref:S6A14-like protein n=1 Tax=Mya arenaria TaxID=6604 RepID=A0ABY7EL07_MYAAR|nr:S6A14-like protein [Mya arenaria]
MKGLGFTMVIVSTFISLYYNVIIAVCIYYFFASMTSELPWSSCSDYSWASCYCRDPNMNSSDPDPWNMTRLECGRVRDGNLSLHHPDDSVGKGGNSRRDALMVPVINCLTSFFAGFVIFSTLGFMAHQKGFSIVETVLTGLIDEFPWLMRGRGRTVAFRGLAIIFVYGNQLLSLFHKSNHKSTFPFLTLSFRLYSAGYVRFRRDIEMMIGDSGFVRVMFYYFAPMWICLTPLGLLVMTLFDETILIFVDF